jgi:hypothetical protein
LTSPWPISHIASPKPSAVPSPRASTLVPTPGPDRITVATEDLAHATWFLLTVTFFGLCAAAYAAWCANKAYELESGTGIVFTEGEKLLETPSAKYEQVVDEIYLFETNDVVTLRPARYDDFRADSGKFGINDRPGVRINLRLSNVGRSPIVDSLIWLNITKLDQHRKPLGSSVHELRAPVIPANGAWELKVRCWLDNGFTVNLARITQAVPAKRAGPVKRRALTFTTDTVEFKYDSDYLV